MAHKSQPSISTFFQPKGASPAVAAAKPVAVIDHVAAEAVKATKAAEEAKKRQDEREKDKQRKKAARAVPLKITTGGSAIARGAQVSLMSKTVGEWKKKYTWVDVESASAKTDAPLGLAHCMICVGTTFNFKLKSIKEHAASASHTSNLAAVGAAPSVSAFAMPVEKNDTAKAKRALVRKWASLFAVAGGIVPEKADTVLANFEYWRISWRAPLANFIVPVFGIGEF